MVMPTSLASSLEMVINKLHHKSYMFIILYKFDMKSKFS